MSKPPPSGRGPASGARGTPPGSVYGEEYRPADARAVVEALRAGRPIPPAPVYG